MKQLDLLHLTTDLSVSEPSQSIDSESTQPIAENWQLSKIIGQNLAVSLLKGAITHNRIVPAYLFAGADGVGKSLAAKCFIAEIFNIQNLANCPDILWVEPTYLHQKQLLSESEIAASRVLRKTPSQIRIEQIREITQFLATSPLIAPYKIVVVENAERMPPTAANALLKTLEEPISGTIILISSQPQRLLATITSRCQLIPFQRLNNAQMTTVLENVGRSEILNHPNVIQFAGGSPGIAIAHHDQLQSIPQSILQQLIQPPSNLLTALSIAKDIEMQLDFHQQLWLIDYLQYCWKEFLSDQNWLLKLEDAKNSLLKMASPRLVWEVLLFPD
ncbi:DNA polymerase III subunit delta' [Sphaerospermopsis kisseleviana CS-549]|uniref:DNA polymerase III subunit delta n=1 Tax=Sphaerospermopsis kisseleviana CS-549 TaxID=3021783 RepID=A0ABT4ZPZ1_9CYAN|nr:DNA polymerase III subunit delta' [Sphaerospermopsis kisseleviana]MDB9441471.1 DNA polymerase III subunit delta' [Sphaerospermopsis kisseleviana CS-549]BAZ83758.1 DNA polymerase III subunit delta' [Sphaerospermopsis kisseleviana NIES-73]